jgi:hypothetical protein
VMNPNPLEGEKKICFSDTMTNQLLSRFLSIYFRDIMTNFYKTKFVSRSVLTSRKLKILKWEGFEVTE